MVDTPSTRGAGDWHILVLNNDDNVGVACCDLVAGAVVRLKETEVTLPADVHLGHKVALRSLTAGEVIVKWGAPIGSATRAIAAGEHIHLHNMKSDYIPTYTFEEGRRFLPGETQT